jgi:hypothetical protein
MNYSESRWWRGWVTAAVIAAALVLPATAASAAQKPPPGMGHRPSATTLLKSAGDRCFRSSIRGRAMEICAQAARKTADSISPSALRHALAHKASPAPRNQLAADPPAPPPQCNFAGGVISAPDRVTSCSDTSWTLIAREIPSGKERGRLPVEDLQWASYAVNSSTWTHGLIVITGQGTDLLTGGATALITSSCDFFATTCRVQQNLGMPDTQLVRLTSNNSLNDGWVEADAGASAAASNQENVLNPEIGVVFFGTGPINPWLHIDINHLTGRCDSIVGNADGCVNQQFTPTLSLSIATYGASADLVTWAQQNLFAHWGLKGVGQPLHRLADPVQQSNNRSVICDGSFTADPTIGANDGDKDSCDEFPFAATYESGALNGVTSGAQCAQVTAVQTNNDGILADDWAVVLPVGTFTGNEACVRAHTPLTLNSAVGGALGRFTPAQRLLDRDAYWVSVTP